MLELQTMDDEEELLLWNNKKMKESNKIRVLEELATTSRTTPARLTFAEAVRITAVEERKGINFKGMKMLNLDNITIDPPSIASPYLKILLKP